MHHVSDNHAPYAVQTPPVLPVMLEPSRHVRLFRNGANQAVRIPKEFEFNASEAVMRKVGDTLVLEPVPAIKPERGTAAAMLLALEELRKLGPISDEFPDIDEGLLPLNDINL